MENSNAWWKDALKALKNLEFMFQRQNDRVGPVRVMKETVSFFFLHREFLTLHLEKIDPAYKFATVTEKPESGFLGDLCKILMLVLFLSSLANPTERNNISFNGLRDYYSMTTISEKFGYRSSNPSTPVHKSFLLEQQADEYIAKLWKTIEPAQPVAVAVAAAAAAAASTPPSTPPTAASTPPTAASTPPGTAASVAGGAKGLNTYDRLRPWAYTDVIRTILRFLFGVACLFQTAYLLPVLNLCFGNLVIWAFNLNVGNESSTWYNTAWNDQTIPLFNGTEWKIPWSTLNEYLGFSNFKNFKVFGLEKYSSSDGMVDFSSLEEIGMTWFPSELHVATVVSIVLTCSLILTYLSYHHGVETSSSANKIWYCSSYSTCPGAKILFKTYFDLSSTDSDLKKKISFILMKLNDIIQGIIHDKPTAEKIKKLVENTDKATSFDDLIKRIIHYLYTSNAKNTSTVALVSIEADTLFLNSIAALPFAKNEQSKIQCFFQDKFLTVLSNNLRNLSNIQVTTPLTADADLPDVILQWIVQQEQQQNQDIVNATATLTEKVNNAIKPDDLASLSNKKRSLAKFIEEEEEKQEDDFDKIVHTLESFFDIYTYIHKIR